MVDALERLVQPGMHSYGIGLGAPKCCEKCSFIVSCKRRSKADTTLQPKMTLPTFYTMAIKS